MVALLIAWGVFALALIAHAILDTPPAPIVHDEDAPAGHVMIDIESSGAMEAIAMSVF